MDVKKTAEPTAKPKKKTSGNTKKKTYKVGDVVNFKGGTHFDSSWSDARGYRATAGKAKITLGPNCAGNGKAHPWHLVHMDSNMESQQENPERPKPDQDRQPGPTIIQWKAFTICPETYGKW